MSSGAERIACIIEQIIRENTKVSISLNIVLTIQPRNDTFQKCRLLIVTSIALKLRDPDGQLQHVISIGNITGEPICAGLAISGLTILVPVNARKLEMAAGAVAHEITCPYSGAVIAAGGGAVVIVPEDIWSTNTDRVSEWLHVGEIALSGGGWEDIGGARVCEVGLIETKYVQRASCLHCGCPIWIIAGR